MDENQEEEAANMIFLQNNQTEWNESEDSFIFQMDVPGVKAHQISIEEKDGEIEVSAIRMSSEVEITKTYQETLYVRPSTSDLTNILATLDQGVLTIIVPKKSNDPIDIETESGSPPAVADDNEEFRTSVDLPGVKASDLKVRASQDKVYIKATRKIGDHLMIIRRTIEVQPSSVDATRARAFLGDGVFTFAAPYRKEDSDNQKPAGMRHILVTGAATDDEVPSAMASLRLDENTGKTDDTAMVVETVTEDDKEEWEEVGQNAKKSTETSE